MWKKDDDATEKAGQSAGSTGTTPAPGGSPSASTRSTGTATIGSAIKIKGEVTGDEDLLIQGRVDGSVDLKEHSVTVGADGRVTASIVARVVTVEGRVDGDIEARERIVLRSSSQVEGDITAPRVVLEDGARFRGGVDMGDQSASGRSGSASKSGSSSASASSPSGSGSSASSGSSGSSKDDASSGRRETTASGSSTGKGSAS
jgi:cytoskeletal protein CcmA (bactofilin family)